MIYLFTSVILFAFICIMLFCIKILEEKSALKSLFDKIHKENIELRELLEVQNKLLEAGI